jgi:hypothetical protein
LSQINVDPVVAKTRASAAVHASWANTRDRSARTAPAREAMRQKYLEQARELQGPDASDEQITQAAEHLRKADLARMSLKAAKARAREKGGAGDAA